MKFGRQLAIAIVSGLLGGSRRHDALSTDDRPLRSSFPDFARTARLQRRMMKIDGEPGPTSLAMRGGTYGGSRFRRLEWLERPER